MVALAGFRAKIHGHYNVGDSHLCKTCEIRSPRRYSLTRATSVTPKLEDAATYPCMPINAPNRMTSKFVPVSKLAGCVVTSWQGVEMALAGRDGFPVSRRDSSVPFVQLTCICSSLNGQAIRLLAEIEVDTDRFDGF